MKQRSLFCTSCLLYLLIVFEEEIIIYLLLVGQLLNWSLCFVLLFLWLFAVSEVDRLLFEVFTSTFLVLFVVAVAGVKGLSKGVGSASLSCVVFPFHSSSCTCLLLRGLAGCCL